MPALCRSTGKPVTSLFVERVVAYQNPLLQEGFLERFSNRDPEGFQLTYPAWHRNLNNKDNNKQGLAKLGIGLKVTTLVHEKNTTQRDSVKEVRMIRSQPILEGTLKAPGCNTFRARPSVSRIFGRKLCKRQGNEESLKTIQRGMQDLHISTLLPCAGNQSRRHCQPPACQGIPLATTDRSEMTQCQAKKTGDNQQTNA